LCSVPERKSVVTVDQREDLLGRVNATHDVVVNGRREGLALAGTGDGFDLP
jgi:hypothetical protein